MIRKCFICLLFVFSLVSSAWAGWSDDLFQHSTPAIIISSDDFRNSPQSFISNNGRNWKMVPSDELKGWIFDANYAAGKLFAVGETYHDDSLILYSKRGQIWQKAKIVQQKKERLWSILHLGRRWLAVGTFSNTVNHNQILESDNGKVWRTVPNVPQGGGISDIAYGHGRRVCRDARERFTPSLVQIDSHCATAN